MSGDSQMFLAIFQGIFEIKRIVLDGWNFDLQGELQEDGKGKPQFIIHCLFLPFNRVMQGTGVYR